MIISAQSPDLVAQSFFNRQAAQGVALTSTQRDAIRQLSKDLVAIGLSNFAAIYPFIGGTAAAHALNLLGSSYAITWSGTLTHSANGVQGDGATGYGDTGLSAATLDNTSNHLAVYSRSPSTPASVMADIGADNGSYALDLYTRRNDEMALFRSFTNPYCALTPNAKTGFFCGSRTASNAARLHRNDGTENATYADAPNAAPALNLFIGATNSSGSPIRFSDTNLAFACIGAAGLTQAQMLLLYNAVQTYETTLNRQV